MTLKKLHTAVEPDQSAVIPYRVRDEQIEVLLVTTRGKGKWIVPKGVIEEDQTPHESAGREAWEEAGVEGHVSSVSLGCYRHGQTKKSPIVEVFLMRVERELKTWPEKGERTRRWIPLDEAYDYVAEPGLRSILDEASDLMMRTLTVDSVNGLAEQHPAVPTANDLAVSQH